MNSDFYYLTQLNRIQLKQEYKRALREHAELQDEYKQLEAKYLDEYTRNRQYDRYKKAEQECKEAEQECLESTSKNAAENFAEYEKAYAKYQRALKAFLNYRHYLESYKNIYTPPALVILFEKLTSIENYIITIKNILDQKTSEYNYTKRYSSVY